MCTQDSSALGRNMKLLSKHTPQKSWCQTHFNHTCLNMWILEKHLDLKVWMRWKSLNTWGWISLKGQIWTWLRCEYLAILGLRWYKWCFCREYLTSYHFRLILEDSLSYNYVQPNEKPMCAMNQLQNLLRLYSHMCSQPGNLHIHDKSVGNFGCIEYWPAVMLSIKYEPPM